MSPRATVAIAFHDEEPFLEAAVGSVLRQTFADFELLLIDDGSTDRSLAKAEAFTSDPRVRVLGSRTRRFLGARLNEALAVARGDVFVRMDGDDLSHPQRLERLVGHLDANARCDAVGSWAAMIDDDERPFGIIEAMPSPAMPRHILRRGRMAHSTMVARTAWLRRYPYDETLTRAEDRDLWCRTIDANIDALTDVLYVFRVLSQRAGFIEDYARGQSDLRRVLRRYGPALVGRRETAIQLASVYLREAATRAAYAAGVHDRLVHRRGRAPTAAERARANEAIQRA